MRLCSTEVDNREDRMNRAFDGTEPSQTEMARTA